MVQELTYFPDLNCLTDFGYYFAVFAKRRTPFELANNKFLLYPIQSHRPRNHCSFWEQTWPVERKNHIIQNRLCFVLSSVVCFSWHGTEIKKYTLGFNIKVYLRNKIVGLVFVYNWVISLGLTVLLSDSCIESPKVYATYPIGYSWFLKIE